MGRTDRLLKGSKLKPERDKEYKGSEYTPKDRKCLNCGKKFRSTCFGNRLCGRCSTVAWKH